MTESTNDYVTVKLDKSIADKVQKIRTLASSSSRTSKQELASMTFEAIVNIYVLKGVNEAIRVLEKPAKDKVVREKKAAEFKVVSSKATLYEELKAALAKKDMKRVAELTK